MTIAYTLDHAPRVLDKVVKKTFERDLAILPCYEIEVDGKTIRYSTGDNSRQSFARVQTIFAKEPTTIPYLETFDKDDLMLDIGANVGMYTVYASVMTGCRVVSIEPEALNYAELNKNIYLNGLHGRVRAYCAAASEKFAIDKLLLGGFTVGHSHHDFGENSWKKEMKWSEKVTIAPEDRIAQGSIAVAIDDLVAQGVMEIPQHIKVDVDGWENKVIAGAKKTLADPGVKTALMELDYRLDGTEAIIEFMESLGWKYSIDQMCTNRQMIMNPDRVRELRRIRKDGFNYIFYRDDAYGDMFRDFLARYSPPYTREGKLVNPPAYIES